MCGELAGARVRSRAQMERHIKGGSGVLEAWLTGTMPTLPTPQWRTGGAGLMIKYSDFIKHDLSAVGLSLRRHSGCLCREFSTPVLTVQNVLLTFSRNIENVRNMEITS